MEHAKIVPHLWFDRNAKEAVDFYISVFKNSRHLNHNIIDDTPSGQADIFTFELSGQEFTAINGGPMFRFSQATSLFVYCGSDEEIERLYRQLGDGGTVQFPLGKYDWSPKYAGITDRFGLGWQLDIDDINSKQKIVPSLLFVNENRLRIKEAINLYTSIFPISRIIMEVPYGNDADRMKDNPLFAQFSLSGYIINSMSSTLEHDFGFNEAISFMVYCKDQEEVDYYWEAFTKEGTPGPCGWLKDKYGLSWQIVPEEMSRLMSTADKKQLKRIIAAMMKMSKLDISVLRKAVSYLAE